MSSPRATPPARDQLDSTPLSFSKESVEAFLPAPQEGMADDSPPEGAVELGDSGKEPPQKKPYQPTTAGPLVASPPHSVGDAFLPLVSGVSAPFGLPSVPAEPKFSSANAPSTTPPATGKGTAKGQEVQPDQSKPPKSTGKNAGSRKNRRGVPRSDPLFDPFTRRRTAPRLPVGAAKTHLPSSTSRLPKEATAAPPTLAETHPATPSVPEESLLTLLGSLRSPDRSYPSERLPNPPFEGSAPSTNQSQ